MSTGHRQFSKSTLVLFNVGYGRNKIFARHKSKCSLVLHQKNTCPTSKNTFPTSKNTCPTKKLLVLHQKPHVQHQKPHVQHQKPLVQHQKPLVQHQKPLVRTIRGVECSCLGVLMDRVRPGTRLSY